jgi:hypothetical protein
MFPYFAGGGEVKIKFEPRDIWIGLYWTKSRATTLDTDTERTTFYICIVPCFPIIFEVKRSIPAKSRYANW